MCESRTTGASPKSAILIDESIGGENGESYDGNEDILIQKKRKNDNDNDTHTDESIASTTPLNSNVIDEPQTKKLKIEHANSPVDVDSEADLKFDEKEQKYDSLLDPKYRKFRPKGYKFNPPPADRPIRIYADGVFDLFHLGHMRQLEQAKKSLPNVILICGVPNDTETHKRKGLTVLRDNDRVETLKHCKWVDEVIPDAPWCVTPEFLETHNIDYVAHDDIPYGSGDSDDIYAPIKNMGMFLTTQRTDGISTSDIITKIIRDYDKYLMRNFARGATRKELNVSWFKKNELDLKKYINDFTNKIGVNPNTNPKDLYSEVREALKKAMINRTRLRLNPNHQNNDEDDDDDNLNSGDSPRSTDYEDADGDSEIEFSTCPSPATEFAQSYTGARHSNLQIDSNKSLVQNVKGWINRVRDKDTQFTPTPSSDQEEDDTSS